MHQFKLINNLKENYIITGNLQDKMMIKCKPFNIIIGINNYYFVDFSKDNV